ncbi:phospholipid carrier-dependent glycosyltransferase [Paenibacillus luteus]|uniref:phospholipid carrier-dependent glycosyltransferase n=1 Tax=Paenibacillus luteus TaxID=2545753 RepID=UPI0011425A88|nr:glycosyltransferase family 39 protein [Paenibacillus luteus]
MIRYLEWLKQNRMLVMLFLVGVVVRVLYAGSIPGGLNQDEASIGYEAYSILHYGMDRNGIKLPIHLIAWGSGQNALYAYLSMPFIYLFGLTPLSVRMASILIGLIVMVLFYLIALQLFQKKHAAVAAAFFIVICPWHIMMSRWALESNIFPTFVLIAVFFLLKAFRQPKWLIAFTVTLAVSLYAYGTSYFFVPVFGAALLTLFVVRKTFALRVMLWNALALFILALPIGLFLVINRFGMATLSFLFSIPKLTVPRVEQVSTVFEGDALSMLAQNFKHFSKMYLTQNDGLLWNAIPGFGFLYPIGLPLVAIGMVYGVYQLIKSFRVETAVIAIWFGTAVLMTLITDVNINRINIIFYPTVFTAVAGLMWLHKRIKYSFVVVISSFSVFFILFCGQYFTTYAKQISPLFFESFGEAVQYASDETEGKVYVTDQVMMPYIYVLFYEKINPQHFLDTVDYINPGGQFQFVRSFGRYEFGTPQLRPSEDAAYIFTNNDAIPDESAGYTLKRFKHYTVVSGKSNGTITTQQPHESFLNGGLEEGSRFWAFSGGAGIGTNRPFSGSNLLYLDPGAEHNAAQTFISMDSGQYVLRAKVSAGGEGGIIGISVNGVQAVEQAVPMAEEYVVAQLPAVTVAEQDEVSVYFTGGAGWLNADDVEWEKQ